jgi:hypothetical protein
VVGPRTKRGRFALALAVMGGAALLLSAASSWAQPARVPWPSYTDGVPDLISHPSDAGYRIGAALLGVAALAVVGLARAGVAKRVAWAVLAALGLGGIALGLDGFATVEGYRGFGSLVANDMTLSGFHHGPFNFVELAGASLLLLAPLAAVSTPIRPRSAASRADRGGTGLRRRRRPGGGRTSTSGS